MPIYEYKCEKCGQEFESLVFAGETPDCVRCSSKNVQRMMSACGFVSKGKGGATVSRAAGASSCGGCSASSCAGCGH